MCRVFGTSLEDGSQHSGDLVIIVRARPAGTGCIVEAHQSLEAKLPTPMIDHRVGDAKTFGNRQIGFAVNGAENDLRPADKSVRQSARGGESGELSALGLGEGDFELSGSAAMHERLRENMLRAPCNNNATNYWDIRLAGQLLNGASS